MPKRARRISGSQRQISHLHIEAVDAQLALHIMEVAVVLLPPTCARGVESQQVVYVSLPSSGHGAWFDHPARWRLSLSRRARRVINGVSVQLGCNWFWCLSAICGNSANVINVNQIQCMGIWGLGGNIRKVGEI